MSEAYNIQVEERSKAGTGESRRMRRAGRVPAVIYSSGNPARLLSVSEVDAAAVAHHAGLLNMQFNDSSETIAGILKDVQRNPIKQTVMHLDFIQVDVDVLISTSLPLEATGEPAGISAGGMLDQPLREVEITCLPTDIPELLRVDVSSLQLGQHMTVADLKLPAGVKLESHVDLNEVVFTCIAAGGAADAEAVAGEVVAAPAVISKSKSEK